MTAVSLESIKSLREQTSAGVMDCKNALEEAGGDMAKAAELLRQKGLILAGKKSSRETPEGVVDCYIHTGNRVGAIVEVNCETDFVARTPEFKELAHNLAMQVAASSPLSIDKSGLDQNILQKEKEIITEELKSSGKDTKIVEKIAIGKLNKFIADNTLLNQEWIMDPKKQVKDVLKEVVGKDKIEIKKFIRFKVGEGV